MQTKQTKARVNLWTYCKSYAPVELIKLAKAEANASFDATVCRSQIEQYLPSLPKGYNYGLNSGLLLKVKNVEPHTDIDTGLANNYIGGVFGVLSTTKRTYLQVGNESTELVKGMWVMFDDSVLHSVQSSSVFYGIAIQIGKTYAI